MSDTFKTIGIIGKFGDAGVDKTLKELSQYLQNRDLHILIDDSTARLISEHGLEVASRTQLGERCDLVIVVGGDGTLLNAARSLAEYEVPIAGINLGRLGFLVDISPDKIQTDLDEILEGTYQEDRRAVLHVEVERLGECISRSDAFNDVTVHKWDVARMIELQVSIDGQFVYTMRADGLIVSTPTGSTAYALSGGGPIVHPGLDALVLVPICPHTMSNRPIVIHGNSKVEILVTDSNTSNTQATCDGQISLGLQGNDKVTISKKEKMVQLIHPADHDYFEMLRAKLHWGEKL